MNKKLIELESLVRRWNKSMNIVSRDDENQVMERHIQDSLQVVNFLGDDLKGMRFLDFGSGMGFPLIPLAISYPDCEFVGVEPREKRVRIINTILRELELKNVKMENARAEDVSFEKKFDVITARAVGKIEEDLKRALPFMKNDSRFVTFKSSAEEVDSKKFHVKHMEYSLSGKSKKYWLISVQKKI